MSQAVIDDLRRLRDDAQSMLKYHRTKLREYEDTIARLEQAIMHIKKYGIGNPTEGSDPPR